MRSATRTKYASYASDRRHNLNRSREPKKNSIRIAGLVLPFVPRTWIHGYTVPQRSNRQWWGRYIMSWWRSMVAADMPLSPLTQWSQEHIRSIFESRSDTEAMLAIGQTFSASLKGTINGKDLWRFEATRASHQKHVLESLPQSRVAELYWSSYGYTKSCKCHDSGH